MKVHERWRLEYVGSWASFFISLCIRFSCKICSKIIVKETNKHCEISVNKNYSEKCVENNFLQ